MDRDTLSPTGSESSEDPVSQILNRLKKFNLSTRVKRKGTYYVARGSYADVWKGANGRKEVAIKVARRDLPKPGKTAQIVVFPIIVCHKSLISASF